VNTLSFRDRTVEILEKLLDGYFEIRPDGTFLYFNPSFPKWLGRSPEELAGKNILDFMDQASRRRFLETLDRVSESDGSEKVRPVELTTTGGQKRVTEIHLALASDHHRQPFFFGTVRDITEDSLFEKEKEKFQEELRQFQKLEAIGRLAGGVAHDFNNLLTGISGYAQLLLAKTQGLPEIHHGLKQIRDLCDRAADLTRQLLAFSRKQPLSSVVLNMNTLIENLSRMVRRIIGEDISLRFIPAPDLWNVAVDPGQMEQVLMNLAVNARDAMPEGGEITIRTSNVVLDEKFATMHVGVKTGFYVEILFTDTGKGIDKATQERIFEPFFTTKEPGKGTGLGLSTVYGIIKQHRGNIFVRSEPGQGTTFEIFLPRAVGPVDRPIKQEEPNHLVSGSETILLVEDEEAVRNVVYEVLKGLGYRVLTAASAEEAKQIFAQAEKEVGLLLTDVVMPGENGFELYKSLSRLRPSLKVLYMSGYAMDTLVKEGESASHIPLLQKPFHPKVLSQKVREILDS